MFRNHDGEGGINIAINKKYLLSSILIVLVLCFAHINGNRLLILACLVPYMALVIWCCSHDFTLPILLFFLPWSPIMRLNPDSFSFYTLGMVLICLISLIKNRFFLRRYQIIAGLSLMCLTLLSKLLDGSGLSPEYIAFIMMIVLFPVIREEGRNQKYNFYQTVIFFSLGIIFAALCAMYFAEYSGIQKFIRVDSYLTIIRRSGFYGDANFYAAQILAALGGLLPLTLQKIRKSQVIWLVIIALLLLYCGFLSGSKSFTLIFAIILLLWIISILRMRGRAGLKIVLLTCIACATVYISASVMFSSLIEVIVTRFSFSKDLNSFTTGRTDLWKSYLDVILGDLKIFLLGKGITNIKVNNRGSHSTVIQIFYQLGIVGAPVLIFWVVCFFRQRTRREKIIFDLNHMIVLVGAFMPWLAIDVLLFDEFFLFQWYVLDAMESWQANSGRSTCEYRLRAKGEN